MNSLDRIKTSLDRDSAAYAAAQPFPHVVIENFLDPEVLAGVIAAFPKPEDDIWNERINDPYQLKLASNKIDLVAAPIRDLMYQLNSASTLKALEALTGEGPLISDPFYEGGGLHQIERGGFLAVHADFNRPRHLPIYRRLNLIIYLNENWDPAFGGNLELWSRDGTTKAASVAPVANRAVIFTTDSTSYHGHPVPLACPPERSRRSLALYYYSVQPADREHTGSTTRWRLDAGRADGDPSSGLASFLWRTSRKLGNYASRLENKAVAKSL